MSLLDNLRDYFLVELPDSLNGFFSFMVESIGGFAWILFLVIFVFLGIIISNITKKQLKLKNYKLKENQFLKELSRLTKPTEIENKIFEFSFKTLLCRYSALYELRGETYIGISSNASFSVEQQKIGLSMKLSKNELKDMKYSGNFRIFKIFSADSNYLLLLFTSKSLDIKEHEGLLQMSLGYYEALEHEVKTTSDKKLAKVSEETMHAIVQAQFGKDGYLKFLMSVILKIFNAKGGEIFSHDGKESYIVGDVSSKLQKEFFIRNTTYKFNFYNDKNITLDDIKEIGAFLDLSGSFLVSLDHQSSIMQNYISFLKSANKIMENTTPYYKNHSRLVKTVALEVAENLFLGQDSLDSIELAAELHDIGMVGNMEVIMNNDKELNEKDINLVHYHPVIGAILLEPIAHLYPISSIVKQHHERYDGKGYPNKLKESDITIDAQTISLAEHFVGLISDRSYKEGMEFDKAVEEIKKVSGKMFDPVVVNSFVESKSTIFKKITKIKSEE